MLQPGSTIGILGGGQLGRMMAVAAAQLGFRVIGYSPPGDNVATQVCSGFYENDWSDTDALGKFASDCDVITWEFENVPLSVLKALPTKLIASDPKALETAQDRLKEKGFVQEIGGKSAPYIEASTIENLEAAIRHIGTPGILKTTRDGYDGKGQWRFKAAADLRDFKMPEQTCIYEGLVEFQAEFSVILVRNRDGEIRYWDSTENVHKDGMLDSSKLPASDLIRGQLACAREIAGKCAEKMNYVGVLTLEFFATVEGPVFNEMAPRVHNSGHWTIEGALTSQFENHIRAICNLPLGPTDTLFQNVEMKNIVGAKALNAYGLLAQDHGVHLHLYGKKEAREGRKMGHMTQVYGARK